MYIKLGLGLRAKRMKGKGKGFREVKIYYKNGQLKRHSVTELYLKAEESR